MHREEKEEELSCQANLNLLYSMSLPQKAHKPDDDEEEEGVVEEKTVVRY